MYRAALAQGPHLAGEVGDLVDDQGALGKHSGVGEGREGRAGNQAEAVVVAQVVHAEAARRGAAWAVGTRSCCAVAACRASRLVPRSAWWPNSLGAARACLEVVAHVGALPGVGHAGAGVELARRPHADQVVLCVMEVCWQVWEKWAACPLAPELHESRRHAPLGLLTPVQDTVKVVGLAVSSRDETVILMAGSIL